MDIEDSSQNVYTDRHSTLNFYSNSRLDQSIQFLGNKTLIIKPGVSVDIIWIKGKIFFFLRTLRIFHMTTWKKLKIKS